MNPFLLQPQPPAEPLDEATHAMLDEAEAQIARGEIYTLDEIRQEIKEWSKAWREARETLPV